MDSGTPSRGLQDTKIAGVANMKTFTRLRIEGPETQSVEEALACTEQDRALKRPVCYGKGKNVLRRFFKQGYAWVFVGDTAVATGVDFKVQLLDLPSEDPMGPLVFIMCGLEG